MIRRRLAHFEDNGARRLVHEPWKLELRLPQTVDLFIHESHSKQRIIWHLLCEELRHFLFSALGCFPSVHKGYLYVNAADKLLIDGGYLMYVFDEESHFNLNTRV
jgi:hypothetical protein